MERLVSNRDNIIDYILLIKHNKSKQHMSKTVISIKY